MSDRSVTSDPSESFSISDLNYELPDERIAQHPPERRDAARMLTIDRETSEWSDDQITDFPDHLQSGDLLVLNDTRVVPAKFTGRRTTGGIVRGLFLHEERPGEWHVLLEGSRRLRVDETLRIAGDTDSGVPARLLESLGKGRWLIEVESAEPAVRVLERIGQTPLPPYIRRKNAPAAHVAQDRDRYQTVYASRTGAIAAPTAGLHFTDELLDAVRERGVEVAFVTLHVGLGTFLPISAQHLREHVMHEEWYEVTDATASSIGDCKRRGKRIVAVGTTTVRVLESAALKAGKSEVVRSGQSTTTLFIYPPYRFQVVDALLTNFHLPHSTLIALIMALAGTELTRRCYRHAIDAHYRFYSYGDAMLVV